VNREYSVVGIFGRLTRIVRILIITNVAVFLVNMLLDGRLTPLLGLSPVDATLGLKLWQFVTYMFVHENLTHILFNMLALWMFGGPVEEAMGSRKFATYYFICGIGAAICTCIFSWSSLSIGASGAIYGLLAAFGMLFPEATVLVFFIFPMRAKYFVLLFAGIELFVTLSSVNNPKDQIAHFAHLGGLLTGYLYLKYHYHLEELYSAARIQRKIRSVQKEKERVQAKQEQKRVHDEMLNKHVDIILDKIRESGMDSLSKEEHDMLNLASERLREKDEKVVDINDYRDRLR